MKSKDLEIGVQGSFEKLPSEFICQAREVAMNARTTTIGFMPLLLLSAAVLLTGAIAYAAPALDKPFLITQPNGESFQARLKGDEWYNWTENLHGYAVEKGEDGVWYYVDTSAPPQPEAEAEMTARYPLTGTKAQEPPPDGLQKLVPPVDAGPSREDSEIIAYAPPKGAFNGHVLLILAQFNDQKGRTQPKAWNSDAPGSLSKISHYYGKASYGLVTLNPASESKTPANDGVIGWINVSARLKQLEIEMQALDQSGNHPNTGRKSGGVAGMMDRLLAKAAILEADRYIDYARYDADGNGTITPKELAIQIVVAGYDASARMPADGKSVWAHAWFIPSGSIELPVVDGKKISRYSMVGELHGGPMHQATMGVMVHELGHHIFDWIDLYNTKDKTEGIGPWDVMGNGNWGRMASQPYAGETPVLPSAYTKRFSKWITPIDAGNGTHPPVNLTNGGSLSATAANTSCIAKTGQATQYFLVEARANIGYDKGLQGILKTSEWNGGVAIWHIDEAVGTNSSNDHRRVDLEAADNANGVDATYAHPSVLWRPAAPGRNIFHHWSTPNSRDYLGRMTHWVVMGIQAKAQGMSASVVKDGSLEVKTLPPNAVAAGAAWRVCFQFAHCTGWLSNNHESTWYPGKATIKFKSLDGWTSPADLPFTFESNKTVALTATYALTPVQETICTAQLNNLLVVFSGKPAKVRSDTYSATGKVVGTVFNGKYTNDFWDYTDTMTVRSSEPPSPTLVEFIVRREYLNIPGSIDLKVSGGPGYFTVSNGDYQIKGQAVCDAMQYNLGDSYSCTPDTEFLLKCSSY